MRLHRLSVTAFGPYAGTEVVDFDALNEAGLFLLTGPTGAGKTSILDAVCFALYGVVPGERGVKTLRSQHADDATRPEVELEVTIGPHRVRIRRSPEWSRPKRRGAGHTREHASATLIDLSGPEERLVSSRIAEVGHELGLVLQMSAEQFMQVVLLPQGQFATFLHASSDERQAVLQRLFATERFARIEDWMRQHTKELHATGARAERRVAQLLATLAHRVEVPLPETLAGDPLGAVAEEARRWAVRLADSADAEQHAAAQAQSRVEAALGDAEDRRRRAVTRAETAQRRLAARAILDESARTQEQAEADQRRLSAHERAVLLLPMVRSRAGLLARQDAAALDAGRLAATLEEAGVTDSMTDPMTDSMTDPMTDPVTDPMTAPPERRQAWQALAAGLGDRLGHLRGLLPRAEASSACADQLVSLCDDLATTRAEHDTAADRRTSLPARREQVVDRLADARLASGHHQAARRTTEEAARRHLASVERVAAEADHNELAAAAVAAREHAADAREHHLLLLERRLRGIAAELAGQLISGVACQVCGSPDHPQPATPTSAPVSRADADSARAAAAKLTESAASSVERLDRATSRLRDLEVASGGLSTTETATLLARRRADLSAVEAAAAQLPALEREVHVLSEEDHRLTERVKATAARCAELTTDITRLETVVATTSQEVDAALGGEPGSLAELLDRLTTSAALLDQAVQRLDELDHLTDEVHRAGQEIEALARDLGFGSAAQAEGALLDSEVVERVRAESARREERRRAAAAVLGELGPDDGPARVDLRLDEVRLEVESATSALAAARTEAQRRAADTGAAGERAMALRSLKDQLQIALEQWEPVRERHAVADSLSTLVRGMSADNQLQMRLSSYVLATRLDQVLAAANERLSAMRGQRYTVRRCSRVAGSGRTGLGLEVLDEWTGEARSPSTLSGGETFVVSLALALGLADVVSEESGGLRVETLFIDEGFGMLDPDTLDDVMDRIDALRSGGRTVGVVSHVPELRSRIPTQVHVCMGRAGSTVTVRSVRV